MTELYPMPYVIHDIWRDDFQDRCYTGDPTVVEHIRNVDVIIARKTLTKRQAAIDYWALDSLYWKTAHQQLLTQRPDEARLEQIAHRRSIMHRMMTHNDAFTTPLGDQL